jgi:hypothetical protein
VNKLEGTIDRNVVSYYFPVEKIEQPWIACPDTIKVNEWVEFSGSDPGLSVLYLKNITGILVTDQRLWG